MLQESDVTRDVNAMNVLKEVGDPYTSANHNKMKRENQVGRRFPGPVNGLRVAPL